jgi:hypothetical protein
MLEYESWREKNLLLKVQKHPIETLVKQHWLVDCKGHAQCGPFEGDVCHSKN